MLRFWLLQCRRALAGRRSKCGPLRLFAASGRRPALEQLEDRTVPNITGTVFTDYYDDGNYWVGSLPVDNAGGGTYPGPLDTGGAGIEVTATNSAGKVMATATTASTGEYTLTLTTAGTYKVTFSGLSTTEVPGPTGSTDSVPSNVDASGGLSVYALSTGGNVQHVANGGSANLGLIDTSSFPTDDPLVATTQFYTGAPSAAPATEYGIQGFFYNAGAQSGTAATVATTPSTSSQNIAPYNNSGTNTANDAATLDVPYSETGPVYSLAWDQTTDTLYAAAYYKEYTDFPTTYPNSTTPLPDPQGVIYAIQVNPTGTLNYNANGTPNVKVFANLGAAAAGTTGTTADGENADAADVGTVGLGGMAISPDGKTLYVMALGNRTLYALSTTQTVNGAPKQLAALPVPSATVPGATGGGTDIEPFAVSYYNNELYIGLVNTALSTQNPAGLQAYVYQANPTTLAFGTNPVFQTSLNYNRGSANIGLGANSMPDDASADWLPWTSVQPTLGSANVDPTEPTSTALVYPQPMLTGIAFDSSGDMTLGIRDRVGDQSLPALMYSSSPYPTARPAGDEIEAFKNPAGTNYESEVAGQDPFATPLILSSPGNQYNAAGMAIDLASTVSNPGNLTLTYSATNLPPGLTIDPTTGTISGTIQATASTTSSYLVTVTAASGNTSSSASFDWSISPAGTPVPITLPGIASPPASWSLSPLDTNWNTAGQTVTIGVSAMDLDGNRLTYMATGLPAGVSIDPLTGIISGTLAAGAASATPYAVTVTAGDGTYSSSFTFSWLITSSAAPAFTLSQQNKLSNVGQTVNVAVGADNPRNLTLTYSASGLPAGLSINPTSGIISGTPSGTPQTTSVTVTATGGGGANAVSFSWTVIPTGATIGPVFVLTSGTKANNVGDTVNTAVLALDPVAPYDMVTYSATSLPTGVSIAATNPPTQGTAGEITGQIAAGDAGTLFTVTVTATDAATNASDSLPFYWTVASPPPPPGSPPVTATSAPPGSTPELNGNGPGGGEYFYVQNYPEYHDHVTEGAVLIVPGFPDVISTVFDPVNELPSPYYSGGIRWMNTGTGADDKQYDAFDNYFNTYVGEESEVVNGSQVPLPNENFGKSNGLGGLASLSIDPWVTLTGGVISSDPNGAPIPGVVVQLRTLNGTLLAKATTNSAGKYLFTSQPGINTNGTVYGLTTLTPNTQYYITLARSNFAVGGPLYLWDMDPPFVGNPLTSSKGVLTPIAGVYFDAALANAGAAGTTNNTLYFDVDPFYKGEFLY